MTSRAAVVLTVGDEILAGFTLDTNSHWIAQRLREHGLQLVSKETLPDDPEAIAEAIRRSLGPGKAQLLVVVGGIGPTPDDRTYQGVAKALGRRLVLTEGNLQYLKRRVAASNDARKLLEDPAANEGLLRMVRLPEGAEPLENPQGTALGAWVSLGEAALVVLPGVPKEMMAMMSRAVLPRLGPPSRVEAVEEVTVVGEEARWYALLSQLARDHPSVRVGSYPQDEMGKIIFRVQGPEDETRRVAQRLRGLAPR